MLLLRWFLPIGGAFLGKKKVEGAWCLVGRAGLLPPLRRRRVEFKAKIIINDGKSEWGGGNGTKGEFNRFFDRGGELPNHQ